MVRLFLLGMVLWALPSFAYADGNGRILDDDVSTAPQDMLPPPADPTIKFSPPAPPPPDESQLVVAVDTQAPVHVRIVTKTGQHACPEAVNRLKPCIVTMPPGHVAIWLDNGLHTEVDLPPGPTQVTLAKERWTLTIPGIVLMSAGLVLEIVGASAESMPLTVVGLSVMGVGAGVLLVGIFVPMDIVQVKHDEFENVAHTRGPAPVSSRALGAALTVNF